MWSGGRWRDMLMCRAGQWWFSSCEVVLGYGQCWICSCAVVVNSGYAHVWEWSIVVCCLLCIAALFCRNAKDEQYCFPSTRGAGQTTDFRLLFWQLSQSTFTTGRLKTPALQDEERRHRGQETNIVNLFIFVTLLLFSWKIPYNTFSIEFDLVAFHYK